MPFVSTAAKLSFYARPFEKYSGANGFIAAQRR
jgi:hypothetical protein